MTQRLPSSLPRVSVNSHKGHFRRKPHGFIGLFEQIQRRCAGQLTAQIANTRAGKPESSFGFGKLATNFCFVKQHTSKPPTTLNISGKVQRGLVASRLSIWDTTYQQVIASRDARGGSLKLLALRRIRLNGISQNCSSLVLWKTFSVVHDNVSGNCSSFFVIDYTLPVCIGRNDKSAAGRTS